MKFVWCERTHRTLYRPRGILSPIWRHEYVSKGYLQPNIKWFWITNSRLYSRRICGNVLESSWLHLESPQPLQTARAKDSDINLILIGSYKNRSQSKPCFYLKQPIKTQSFRGWFEIVQNKSVTCLLMQKHNLQPLFNTLFICRRSGCVWWSSLDMYQANCWLTKTFIGNMASFSSDR